MNINQELKKVSYFSSLTPSALSELNSIVNLKTYQSGEIIFLEEDSPSGLYIIKKGKVKIYKLSADGRSILLEIIHPGTSFGEVAVFDGKNFPANAEAMTQAEVIFIHRSDFLNFLKNNPDVALQVIKDLGARLRYAQNRVRSLITRKAEERMASIILKLTQKLGQEKEGGFVVDLPLTRQDIAEMTGTTQETAIRILSKWQKENLIIFKNKKLVVIDQQRIEERTGLH